MELKDIILGKRRGRLEIIHEILSICRKPVLKTHVMHRCNLSYTNLLEILKLLVSNGLLSNFDGTKGKVYTTTDKGSKFIKSFEQLREILSHVSDHPNSTGSD